MYVCWLDLHSSLAWIGRTTASWLAPQAVRMRSKEHTLLKLALVIVVAEDMLEALFKSCLTILQLPSQSLTCMHATVSRCTQTQSLSQKGRKAGPYLGCTHNYSKTEGRELLLPDRASNRCAGVSFATCCFREGTQ